MVPLSWYLIFAALLFSIGLFGVLSRRNAVAILLGIELMLNCCEHQPGCLLAIWRCDPNGGTGVRDHRLRGGCGGSGCRARAGDLRLSPPQHGCGGRHQHDEVVGTIHMTTEALIWLIPLPPVLAFFLIVLFTNRSKALSHTMAVGAAFLSWLGSMIVFVRALGVEHLGEHPFESSVAWLPLGETVDTYFRIGVLVDPTTAVVLFFVAITIFMIFLYSVGYHNFGQPKGDHDHKGLPPHGATVEEHGHTSSCACCHRSSRCIRGSLPSSACSPLACMCSFSRITC